MLRTDRFTFYCGIADPFSNFHPAPITFSGWPLEPGNIVKFKNAETAYAYIKALTFEDEKLANLILLTPTPQEAKRLGRQVKDFDKDVWNEVSYEAMCRVCMLKYEQNPRLLKALVDSAGRF